MADIQLKKVNDVYTKVTAEPAIEKELSEYFKYQIPNHQFTPAGKKGWDGFIKLYNLRTKRLYAGLLKYLFDFARERGYSVEHNPDLFLYNNFSRIEAREFIKSLNIHSRGEPVEAREYQEIGLAKAVRYKKLTMISPTRSGKSLILYSFVRFLTDCRDHRRGLLIVPTTGLVEQVYTDFEDYSSHNHWPVQDRIQRLYDGYSNEVLPETQLLVSTWQSLYRLPDSFFTQFDFLIGDECIHPETNISMGDGSVKAIKDINPGDIVKSFNEKTQVIENNIVTKLHKNISIGEQMFELKTEEGSILKITGNHKVLLSNGKWIRVDQLEIGDIINSI